MSVLSLVYPMAAMVLLTMVVLVRLFRSRVAAVRAGQVDAAYFRLYQGAEEPESTRKVSRHFVNLFEAPTLFYVVCLAAMVANAGGFVILTLAWSYVAARAIHSLVHLGGNRLRKRIASYFASWLILAAMWAWLVISVLRGIH
jgi:hypothetical protein